MPGSRRARLDIVCCTRPAACPVAAQQHTLVASLALRSSGCAGCDAPRCTANCTFAKIGGADSRRTPVADLTHLFRATPGLMCCCGSEYTCSTARSLVLKNCSDVTAGSLSNTPSPHCVSHGSGSLPALIVQCRFMPAVQIEI